MAIPIFITGIGTGVGKTLVSAIVTEALHADYWKPVQTGVDYAAGTDPGDAVSESSDSAWVRAHLSNPGSLVYPELYTLALPASPHLAARREHVRIDPDEILAAYKTLPTEAEYVIVEGAGGLLVPLNESHFMSDLALRLRARVILVSRNYLGSINHSLLTARVCRELGLDVLGWIFNGHYSDYEAEIVHWSGYPWLGRIPESDNPDVSFVLDQAEELREVLLNRLSTDDKR
jgi:dethiobiotin synthetase